MIHHTLFAHFFLIFLRHLQEANMWCLVTLHPGEPRLTQGFRYCCSRLLQHTLTPNDSLARDRIKEKYGVWDPMPELTLTSSYVHSRVNSNTFTMSNPTVYARVDRYPMPELTFSPSQGIWIWPEIATTAKKF